MGGDATLNIHLIFVTFCTFQHGNFSLCGETRHKRHRKPHSIKAMDVLLALETFPT
jgi:hypothetical protein